MKSIKIISCSLLLAIFSTKAMSQKEVTVSNKGDYTVVDLYTGETINVYYDTVNWRTMNKANNAPTDYYVIKYVNPSSAPDTVHGVTGIIVNGMVWKNADGKWLLNDAHVKWDGNEWKMKDRYGRKVKWEKGELKIKDWNSKYKSEQGDDAKYKEEWDKVKWKEDGMKVEEGTKKIKTKTN